MKAGQTFGLNGWLDPEGKFHACPYGQHIGYVFDWIEENKSEMSRHDEAAVRDLKLPHHVPFTCGFEEYPGSVGVTEGLLAPQIEWVKNHLSEMDAGQKAAVHSVLNPNV